MLKLLNFTLFGHVFRVDFAINGILNTAIMWWVYLVDDDLFKYYVRYMQLNLKE